MPAPKGHKPYPGCETGGRPRKYKIEDVERFADLLIEWIKKPDSIWYEDFCVENDIDPDWMSEWAKENEKFGGAYKKARTWQKSTLIRGGLLNRFNSNITKLVLSNTCGFTDKSEQQNVTNNTTYNVNYADSEQVLPEKLPAKNSKSTRQRD